MDAAEKVYRFYERYRGEKFVYGRSAAGQPLVGVHVGGHGYPQVIAQYAIHAREWVTSLLALGHVGRAESGCFCSRGDRGGVSVANKDLCGGVYILPLTNPDGAALALRGESFLRTLSKERAAFLEEINGGKDFSLWKANAEGVDLNVNFPARWGTGRSNVFSPAPQNFVGSAPLCAPESAALAAFTEKVRPAATVSFHTKGREIYWEFFQKGEGAARDARIARALSEETGYAVRKTPSSAGGYKDWCVETFGIPAFTVETGDDGLAHPLGEGAFPAIWQENAGVPNRLIEELIAWKKR